MFNERTDKISTEGYSSPATSPSMKIMGKAKPAWNCGQCGKAYTRKRLYDYHVERCQSEPTGGCSVGRALKLAHCLLNMEQ